MAKNSPAEKVGLKSGDIILKLDGAPVADSRALQLAVGQMTPGRAVRLTVFRDGSERDFSGTLGEQPRDGAEAESSRDRTESNGALDGVSAETLTPDLAAQFNIAPNTKGVVVRRVDPGSAAAQAGLERGDVILEVNRHPVATVEQLNRYISDVKDSILLFVNHDRRTRFVVIPSK